MITPLHAFKRELQVSKQLTTVELPPFNATETAELASQVSDREFDRAAISYLVHASEGNPLFIVEMVQSGGWTASRTGAHAAVGGGPALPPRVYAVIQQRLAQLSPAARTLVALAATIGRSFTFNLLCAASERGEDEVVNGLDELWRRKIIRERVANTYDFSHDRIRDIAYAAISPILRPQLHKRVALALEEYHRHELNAVSAQLAAHYERAALAAKAVEFYQLAAAAEAKMLAHTNAVAYLDLGLTLLRQQPYTVERVQQELTLLLSKAYSLAIYGFTTPDVAAICTELETCLLQIVDDQLRFHAYQRLRGERLSGSAGFLLDANVQVSAEAAFQQALAIARKQEAKSFELRATTAFCRLWQRQGKADQAYQTLSALYGWFTEGFETQDLRVAHALLTDMMVFVPGSNDSLGAFSTEPGPLPWIMFPDPTYAHLMVTILDSDN